MAQPPASISMEQGLSISTNCSGKDKHPSSIVTFSLEKKSMDTSMEAYDPEKGFKLYVEEIGQFTRTLSSKKTNEYV